MAKLKTLEDLKRIREEAQQTLKIRLDTGTTITVGMGTCGIAAGARDTMRAILDELAGRDIDAPQSTPPSVKSSSARSTPRCSRCA